jgi:hypothetical protein
MTTWNGAFGSSAVCAVGENPLGKLSHRAVFAEVNHGSHEISTAYRMESKGIDVVLLLADVLIGLEYILVWKRESWKIAPDFNPAS